MGRIGRAAAFIRRVVKGVPVASVTVAPGSGASITAEHYGPAGDDAPPLPTDYGCTVGAPGRECCVGYHDTVTAGVALPGDKRIFARDSSSGAVVGTIWLRRSGVIEITSEVAVTIEAPSVVLGDGSSPVARAGDFVSIQLPVAAGGAAVAGKILQGQSKVLA